MLWIMPLPMHEHWGILISGYCTAFFFQVNLEAKPISHNHLVLLSPPRAYTQACSLKKKGLGSKIHMLKRWFLSSLLSRNYAVRHHDSKVNLAIGTTNWYKNNIIKQIHLLTNSDIEEI